MRISSTALLTTLLAFAPAAGKAAEDSQAPSSKTKDTTNPWPEGPPAVAMSSPRRDVGTNADPANKGSDAGAKAEAPKTPPAAPVTATAQGERFQIRRGWFAMADLGVFATFGGRDVRNQQADGSYPKKTISNIEPQLGLVVGRDLISTDKFDFALGLKFGMGLNAGAGRASATEMMDPNAHIETKSNDYSVIETALEASAAFLTSERFAITTKLDLGGGWLDPDPTKSADLPGAGSPVFAPMFGLGVGFEFYTLLNDFSIGLFARFQAILAPGGGTADRPYGAGLIPAATLTAPIKYTF